MKIEEQWIDGPVAGIIMTLRTQENRVVASASNFEKSGYGGFSLQQSQEYRCKKDLAKNLVKENCGYFIAEIIKQDTSEKILEDCLSAKCVIHKIIIKHKKKD